MTTKNLGLILTSSDEWGTKKYREFIEEQAGTDETSNMQLIDAAIGELQEELDALEEQLALI